ncbi:hypothetical protein BDZ97DRAFT_1756989 [Flammula alnicola]|nr:hypothetical protein BDZ97DRAFT_1756989 [Flammula alnicola]
MSKSKKPKQRTERTIWLPGEEAVLRKHKDTWLNLDSKRERDAFAAGTVTEEIRNLSPHLYSIVVVRSNKKAKDEWDRRCKAIKNWFNNHRGPDTLRRVFKFERKIPLCQVVGHCKRADVDKRAEKLFANMTKGSKASLSQYQKALSAVMDDLTDDDKDMYERSGQSGRKKGLPRRSKEELLVNMPNG